MPVIPVLRRPRDDDWEFKASLCWLYSETLSKKKKKREINKKKKIPF
jgi:hypothetical protein